MTTSTEAAQQGITLVHPPSTGGRTRRVNGSASPAVEPAAPRVPGHRRIELCRLLAAGEVRRADLARRYGISRPAITQFARRNAALIDEMRQDLRAEKARQMVGLWIAEKENRLAAYESDFELSLSGPFSGHYEQIKTRALIMKQVADELGENQAKFAVVPVTHIVIGVDPEDLK